MGQWAVSWALGPCTHHPMGHLGPGDIHDAGLGLTYKVDPWTSFVDHILKVLRGRGESEETLLQTCPGPLGAIFLEVKNAF